MHQTSSHFGNFIVCCYTQFKILVYALCTFMGVASTASASKVLRTEKHRVQLLKTAVSSIKKTIKQAKGTPYFVSCAYKIKNNKPVSALTEIHYLDYRKKPDAYSVDFVSASGVALDRVVKFVYKPKTNVLSVVDLDADNRHLATRKVSLAI